jgi:FemAB-related protein (PEP-CTERM system-associated)
VLITSLKDFKVENSLPLLKRGCLSGVHDASPVVTNQNQSHIRVISKHSSLNDTWSTVPHQLDNANLAQLPEWFTIIQKAYGHTPLYLEAEDGRGRRAVLPSFLVRSRLFGTVVTSMPFLDTGGPCSPSEDLAHILVHSLIAEAARFGANLVELRSTVTIDLPLLARTDKVNMFLPLTRDSGALWHALDSRVRNQVRKAERSGLAVEFGGAEKLRSFYDIFAVNMRDLGSPVHGCGFFHAIFDAFGDKARVVLVRKGIMPIGGLVALAFKNRLIVPWASSLREYFSLCPNMLLYWETLRTACVEGFQRFDFGRSSRNSGTYRFKRQWGAVEEPLFWYTIPIGRGARARLSSADARGAMLVRLWQSLPLRVTRWFGPYIRRYLTL